MKYNIKQLVFIALAAILSSFLLTCFSGPPDYEDFVLPEFTDVEYSPDGRYVTIYLDGSAPVRNSRALNLKWAQIGFDFFEVTFMSGSTVARATWETGHAAGVHGVARGVDYASAIPGGAGSANLFVGKKSDKTLLAVGKLTGTDDAEGGLTFVSANTRSVTFSVAALRAGTSDSELNSSFKASNTDSFKLAIGPEFDFPLFRMDENAEGGHTAIGQYEFGVFGDNFENYRQGIIKQGNTVLKFAGTVGGVNYERVPRYPIGNNGWVISPTASINKYPVDTNTPISVVNPAAGIGAAFDNDVRFTIGPTLNTQGSTLFVFSFEVPVYPLTNAGNPGTWYLRPGYDSYLYDLDDGRGGSGGSILMGTGKFDPSVSSDLVVRKPPDKTRYNGQGSNPWDFTIAGMELYLRRGDSMTAILPTPGPGITSGDLYYVLEHPTLLPPDPKAIIAIRPGEDIEQILIDYAINGEVIVHLEYYGAPVDKNGLQPYLPTGPGGTLRPNPAYAGAGGTPFTGRFSIFYLPLDSSLDFTIPDENRFVVVNYEDINLTMTGNPDRGNVFNDPTSRFLIVVFASVDFTQIQLPTANAVFIVLIAGAPNVVIGVDSASGGVFMNQRAGNTYYLGAWPFDEVLAVQGMPVKSYPFVINAGGSYTAVTGSPPTATPHGPGVTDYFINGGYANTNVHAYGVTVLNNDRFEQP